MRRIAGALTAVVAAAALLAGGQAASGRALTPKLTVTNLSPVVVVGTGFAARELVRVAVRSEERAAVKRAAATASGAIFVRFAALKLTNCSAYLVSASGNEGSSARVRAFPRACGADPRGAP